MNSAVNKGTKIQMANKTFWRCNVCNDVHYGIAGPKTCPTCQTKNVYVEVIKEEAQKVMGF